MGDIVEILKEKRKKDRRLNFYTRQTDVFENNKRKLDRRESIKLKQELLSKIKVKPPYFALTNLKKIETGLKANIPIEQSLWRESSPITAGESARHLAILGSCVIALTKEGEECYYLATKANYQRHTPEIKAKNLIGTAKVINLEKRKATAYTELLTQNNQLITSLEVEYAIMTKKLFERQFAEHKVDMRNFSFTTRQNFYKQFNFNPKINNQNKESIVFDIGEIIPEMCMGHFPMYPALPVAFFADILLKFTTDYFKKLVNPNFKLYIKYSYVFAEQLAFSKKMLF